MSLAAPSVVTYAVLHHFLVLPYGEFLKGSVCKTIFICKWIEERALNRDLLVRNLTGKEKMGGKHLCHGPPRDPAVIVLSKVS